ncbi:MAG: bifunctional indole-3-glycerol phosphate synthase/phosphoribosylanthranilate isomerase [Treponema sp.]|nr:bifunctional indole-3-glycerol phosphate synthase/phosphoribosylanthranilate isomerase [Treponema sp.]
MRDILSQIIEKRRADLEELGFGFGFPLPEERTRAVHPFLESRGVILEVKRASPSKGDISPDLDPAATARSYAEAGARAISCLTEKNYFKGSLADLAAVCRAADDFERETGRPAPAVLRKDFLLSPEEIAVSYRAGADAVLLIARILPEERLLEMAQEVERLGMSALVEVRTEEDVEKLAFLASHIGSRNIVCGVNSRDLATFKIDLLRPCMMTGKIRRILGADARIIFESGVTTYECASSVGAMGFSGLLLGEAAAKNPSLRKGLVDSFMAASPTRNSDFWKDYAERLSSPGAGKKTVPKVKICGLTRSEDAVLAHKLGADFLGFVFADAFPRSVTREGRLKALLPGLKGLDAIKIAVVTDVDSEEGKLAVQLVKEGVFTALQFHKVPSEKVGGELRALPHYFAVDSLEEYERLVSKGEMRVLFDSKQLTGGAQDPVPGNAGYGLNWFAGGINPENVLYVMERFSPELIDVSSGIEDDGRIGIKSEGKMRDLMRKIGEVHGQ